jgi:hypothetical protein
MPAPGRALNPISLRAFAAWWLSHSVRGARAGSQRPERNARRWKTRSGVLRTMGMIAAQNDGT